MAQIGKAADFVTSLYCYGPIQHLDNGMSSFVSHNDANTSSCPVWTVDFNSAILQESLRVERVYYHNRSQ